MTDHHRTVLALTGGDRVSFLQNLVTNNVENPSGPLVYAALLTPQGKFVADFFVVTKADRMLIDVATSHAPMLFQKLSMYRLRADVQIAETDILVSRGTGSPPTGALPDPRHPELGWRHYGDADVSDATDWDALHVAHLIPQTGEELTPDTYILEAGFERLNGIDFRKGCYVGQEIAARMKHKTDLRKGLALVEVDATVSPGDEITAAGRPAGHIHSVHQNRALAYLRYDRTSDMTAKDSPVTLLKKATDPEI
ncbi:MAG: folate-binding protein [Pseudomonadota bacterium]